MTSIAVDTNVLVRLATGDSAGEHAAAAALLANTSVFVASTVLLEMEWVLRSRYRYRPTQFVAFVRWLLHEPGVEFVDSRSVRRALDLHEDGFVFADAMHIVASAGRPFATFDRALLRRARARQMPIHAMTGK